MAEEDEVIIGPNRLRRLQEMEGPKGDGCMSCRRCKRLAQMKKKLDVVLPTRSPWAEPIRSPWAEVIRDRRLELRQRDEAMPDEALHDREPIQPLPIAKPGGCADFSFNNPPLERNCLW